jgi:FkbH-like protein
MEPDIAKPALPSPRPNGPGAPAQNAATTLVVAATFTADPLLDALTFWNAELQLHLAFKCAPYNQVFQQLLDPAGLLATNVGGLNAILVRFEDWAGTNGTPSDLEENVRQFIHLLQTAAAHLPGSTVVLICPSSPRFAGAHAELLASLEAEVVAATRDISTVLTVTSRDLAANYPVADYYDEHSNQLGHIPYTPLFFAALGTALMRKVYALRSAPYKVIVLDCDETLWSGICGEDGPRGISIDPPRRALQQLMLEQYNAGMLLCMASKNNEDDVIETFRENPDMPLTLDHFVARRVNWDPKPANLMDLASELELGLDSFILVDDNAKECAEVQANCPDVLTLLLPAKIDEIPAFLSHVWAFDHLRTTEEDRKRSAMYAQKLERTKVEKQGLTLQDFIAALQLEITITPMAAHQLSRVSQLTLRTNQMNCSVVRRSEADIQTLLQSGKYECLTVDVSDRFGSYGLTGVMIATTAGDALLVDTFLLSCRALGRGVEHQMLARLGQIATSRGLKYVDIPYVPAGRNKPALLFLRSIAADYEQVSPGEVLFRIPANEAASVDYHTATAFTIAGSSKAEPARTARSRSNVDLATIAAELRTPEQILARILAQRATQSRAAQRADAPRTDLERRLVDIWSNLLGVSAIGIHDNFFDLGGHSLLAVQLLSIVQKTFGADLSLKIVYSGDFTVAELAKAIELYEIQKLGGGEYDSLLAELEGLSDEEVAALLAQEQSDQPGQPG